MNIAQDQYDRIIPKAKTALKNALSRVLNWRIISIWFCCSLIVAFAGPFGTYQNQSPLDLLVKWLVLLGVAILLAYTVDASCRVFMPSTASRLYKGCVFAPISSILVGLSVDLFLTYAFISQQEVRPEMLELSAFTLAVILLMFGLRAVIATAEPFNEIKNSPITPVISSAALPRHSRLAKRLDIPQDKQIIHITAQGHFVEVRTCSKTYRIRIRFSDAVDELDSTIGLTVHRSHWAHRDAIKGWVPTARKPYVLLEDGTRVPVSKTYFEKVLAADLVTLEDPKDSAEYVD